MRTFTVIDFLHWMTAPLTKWMLKRKIQTKAARTAAHLDQLLELKPDDNLFISDKYREDFENSYKSAVEKSLDEDGQL